MTTETKRCPRCDNDRLVLLRTLNEKRCPCDLGAAMPWNLAPGQKPVGYCVSPELTNAKLTANIKENIKS